MAEDNKNALFMEEEFDLLPDDDGDDDDITDTQSEEAAVSAKDSAAADQGPAPDADEEDEDEDFDPYGYEPLDGSRAPKKEAGTGSVPSGASQDKRAERPVPGRIPKTQEPKKKSGLAGIFRFNYEDGSDKHLEELFSGRKEDEKAGQDSRPEGRRAGLGRRAGKGASVAAQEGGAGDFPAREAVYSAEPPVSMAAYLGYMLLFSIPVVGVIVLLVQAFAAKNSAIRTFARAFLCFMIIMLLLFTELALLGATKYLF